MIFSKQLAIECAELIDQLYRSNFEPTFNVLETDTQVQVAERTPGEVWVIFPGTASAQDWLTDLKVRKIAWGETRAHRGFATAFRSVAGPLLAHLKSARQIIITGHSLGGALATLAADLCSEAGLPVAAVYTFGSPRVGNGPFARAYNARLAHCTFRVVNARDPVPHVPWLLGTYRHVDTQVYLNANGFAVIAEPLRVAALELAQTLGTATQQQAARAALDVARPHHIGSYLQKLKGLHA